MGTASALPPVYSTTMRLPDEKYSPTDVLVLSPQPLPSKDTRVAAAPLLLIPHGGPHGVFVKEFMPRVVAL
jgi:dipeptidyl aminopeptidase/acylaminoacyl peptidase